MTTSKKTAQPSNPLFSKGLAPKLVAVTGASLQLDWEAPGVQKAWSALGKDIQEQMMLVWLLTDSAAVCDLVAQGLTPKRITDPDVLSWVQKHIAPDAREIQGPLGMGALASLWCAGAFINHTSPIKMQRLCAHWVGLQKDQPKVWSAFDHVWHWSQPVFAPRKKTDLYDIVDPTATYGRSAISLWMQNLDLMRSGRDQSAFAEEFAATLPSFPRLFTISGSTAPDRALLPRSDNRRHPRERIFSPSARERPYSEVLSQINQIKTLPGHLQRSAWLEKLLAPIDQALLTDPDLFNHPHAASFFTNQALSTEALVNDFLRAQPQNSVWVELQKRGCVLTCELHAPAHASALVTAARSGKKEHFDTLIQHGADPCWIDGENQNTLWHLALILDSQELEKLLLSLPAQTLTPIINHKNAAGKTPLHLATAALKTSVVKHLLEIGADPLVTDDQGQTPIESIRRTGLKARKSMPSLLALLQEHSDPTKWSQEQKDKAFIRATAALSLTTAQELLNVGANVNAVSSTNKTALIASLAHFAPCYDHKSKGKNAQLAQSEVVDFLIANGIDVNHQDQEGNAALHLATSRGLTNIVRALFGAGADWSLKNKAGSTAMHAHFPYWNSQKGQRYIDIVYEFYKADADLSQPGVAPRVGAVLPFYSMRKDPEVIQFLNALQSKQDLARVVKNLDLDTSPTPMPKRKM